MSNNSKTLALYGEIDVSNMNKQKQKSIICQTVRVCLKERKNILIMPNYSPPPKATKSFFLVSAIFVIVIGRKSKWEIIVIKTKIFQI